MNNLAKKIIVFAATAFLIISLVISWTSTDKDIDPYLSKVLPEAQSFQKIASSPAIYEGQKIYQDGKKEEIGCVVIDQSPGYGGQIKVVTGINLQGKIIGTAIADNKDTPSFISRILDLKFLDKFIGKDISDPLAIGKDIDSVSGATFSSRGITKAISLGSHAVARSQFGKEVNDETEPFKFGQKEIEVISLVILMMIGIKFKLKKMRWVTLICSLILIGFVYNTPISLANIAALLTGNLPSIRTNFIWYVLLVGIPVITLVAGKNVYCFWMCPFGALQEITAKIGGGKLQCCNKSINSWISKIRYILIYTALIGAVLTNSPSSAGYEPFATLFGLQGFGIQWLILPVVFFSSFFINRFWCRFFCPGFILNKLLLSIKSHVKKLLKKIYNRKNPLTNLSSTAEE